MKKEYKYPSMEVLELDILSQLMAGTIVNADATDADIDPVVDGGHEQPRAKEAGEWSYDWD
ncbi:MAG: hypothetical protein K6A78_02205 [Prevotella sp.]|nr:hypothetical protein [Prevotella sp.]